MRYHLRAATLALAGLAAALVAGCGSSSTVTATVTHTVTVSPTTTSSSSQTRTTATSSTQSAAATTTGSSTTSATSTTQSTRTESAPAFVTPVNASAELKAAIAVLAKAGYVPLATSTYHPADTLRVLIGRRSSGAAGELAFFFDQTTYLGMDSTTPSAQISVVSAVDTEVVLGYAIFSPGASTPSGVRYVHFALDMGQLGHADALPSVSARR
jgi:LppP/LprE lipoprotein